MGNKKRRKKNGTGRMRMMEASSRKMSWNRRKAGEKEGMGECDVSKEVEE